MDLKPINPYWVIKELQAEKEQLEAEVAALKKQIKDKERKDE